MILALVIVLFISQSLTTAFQLYLYKKINNKIKPKTISFIICYVMPLVLLFIYAKFVGGRTTIIFDFVLQIIFFVETVFNIFIGIPLVAANHKSKSHFRLYKNVDYTSKYISSITNNATSSNNQEAIQNENMKVGNNSSKSPTYKYKSSSFNLKSKLTLAVSLVGIGFGVCIVLASLNIASMVVAIIGMLLLIPIILIVRTIKHICPRCHNAIGKEINSQYVNSSTAIERRIIDKNQVKYARGHVDYIDGKYYEEVLTTTHNYDNTYKCSECGHEWHMNKQTKQQ